MWLKHRYYAYWNGVRNLTWELRDKQQTAKKFKINLSRKILMRISTLKVGSNFTTIIVNYSWLIRYWWLVPRKYNLKIFLLTIYVDVSERFKVRDCNSRERKHKGSNPFIHFGSRTNITTTGTN